MPHLLVLDWIANRAGEVDAVVSESIRGRIYAISTKPDDVTPPTDPYSIQIEDADGVDLLRGQCIDRSTSAQQTLGVDQEFAQRGPVILERFRFRVQNAGQNRKGRALLYYE